MIYGWMVGWMDGWMDLGNQIWRPPPPNLIAAFLRGGIRYMDDWMDETPF